MNRPLPAPRHLVLAALFGLAAQLLVWLPFAGRSDVLVRHFDGPNYLVVAKTLYRPTAVNPMPGYIGSPSYFAVHLPAYPLAVRALVPLAGWPNALLLATALFGMASAVAFVLWISDAVPDAPWLPLLLVFLLLPPRSFLYRALGATEAPMAFFVLVALWARGREKTGLAVAAAGLASVCRINGVLLVGLLALELLHRRRPMAAVAAGAAGLAPLALVFAWQSAVLGRATAFLDTHGASRRSSRSRAFRTSSRSTSGSMGTSSSGRSCSTSSRPRSSFAAATASRPRSSRRTWSSSRS